MDLQNKKYLAVLLDLGILFGSFYYLIKILYPTYNVLGVLTSIFLSYVFADKFLSLFDRYILKK